MDKRKILFTRILFGLYFVVLGYLCFGSPESFPGVEASIFNIPTDKLVHFLMFSPYSILFWYSINRESIKCRYGVIVLIFLSGCLFGGLTELIQDHIPGRSCDLMDFLADVYAIGAGALAVIAIQSIRKPR